jgi:hypothetical protein
MWLAAQLPELFAEAPDLEEAIGGSELHPIFEVVPVGFGVGFIPPYREAAAARCSIGCHAEADYRSNLTS